MRIAVLKEAVDWERRVPIVPDSIKRLGAKKIEVVVERGAGERALAFDTDYEAAGALLRPTASAAVAEAECVMRLRVPTLQEVASLKSGTTLVAPIFPLVNKPWQRGV